MVEIKRSPLPLRKLITWLLVCPALMRSTVRWVATSRWEINHRNEGEPCKRDGNREEK